MEINFIFSIAVLIMSVVMHEVSHGLSAYYLGDITPKAQGRLTLNPLKHLDPLGSIIFPAISYFLGGIIFGWAKPVQINPYNLKYGKWGEAIVAFAGPLSNILLAVFFGILIRNAEILSLSASFVQFSSTIIVMNLVLAVFNMIPIPPLDGSKVLFAFLPTKLWEMKNFLERYSLPLIIFVLFFLSGIVSPVVTFLFKLIVG